MATIHSRQTQTFVDDNGNVFTVHDGFWWTREGQILRWSLFLAFFVLFMAYMIGGYWHARRRIKKGLPPLAYHRWLLSRRQRAAYDPTYQNPHVYYNSYPQGGQYRMQPMPPPMYDPNSAMPPSYQPPAGATKVDPSQWRAEPTRRPQAGDASPAYEAPPGPLPAAALQVNHTGASAVSNNPYRV